MVPLHEKRFHRLHRPPCSHLLLALATQGLCLAPRVLTTCATQCLLIC